MKTKIKRVTHIFYVAFFICWNLSLLPTELIFTMADKMYTHVEYQAVIENTDSGKVKLYKKNVALSPGWLKTPGLELENKNASSLCFFNDHGVPTLAIGTQEGDIMLWQWNSHKWILASLWHAHEGCISKITYSTNGKKRFLTIFSEQNNSKNSTKTWLI